MKIVLIQGESGWEVMARKMPLDDFLEAYWHLKKEDKKKLLVSKVDDNYEDIKKLLDTLDLDKAQNMLENLNKHLTKRLSKRN